MIRIEHPENWFQWVVETLCYAALGCAAIVVLGLAGMPETAVNQALAQQYVQMQALSAHTLSDYKAATGQPKALKRKSLAHHRRHYARS